MLCDSIAFGKFIRRGRAMAEVSDRNEMSKNFEKCPIETEIMKFKAAGNVIYEK